ncbi:hypothetical protein ABFT38_005058 [Salmonella enterica]
MTNNKLNMKTEEEMKREARRVAEVVRAEFWLGNPVTQREDIELAHEAALKEDDIRNSDAAAVRVGRLREKFERWVEDYCELPKGSFKKHRRTNAYELQVYSFAWEAYQAGYLGEID